MNTNNAQIFKHTSVQCWCLCQIQTKIGRSRQFFAKIQINILSVKELRLLGALGSMCTEGREGEITIQVAHFRNRFAEAHVTAVERIS
jgi:hypothetical protein